MRWLKKAREKKTDESCNCRNENKCPKKEGNCKTESVIYEASASKKMKPKYAANQIKKNTSSYNTIIYCRPENKNYIQYINSAELSTLIHKLKQEDSKYNLRLWKKWLGLNQTKKRADST